MKLVWFGFPVALTLTSSPWRLAARASGSGEALAGSGKQPSWSAGIGPEWQPHIWPQAEGSLRVALVAERGISPRESNILQNHSFRVQIFIELFISFTLPLQIWRAVVKAQFSVVKHSMVKQYGEQWPSQLWMKSIFVCRSNLPVSTAWRQRREGTRARERKRKGRRAMLVLFFTLFYLFGRETEAPAIPHWTVLSASGVWYKRQPPVFCTRGDWQTHVRLRPAVPPWWPRRPSQRGTTRSTGRWQLWKK